MATVRLRLCIVCALFVFTVFLPTCIKSQGYYSYEVSTRDKRYVSEVINKLADSYDKGASSSSSDSSGHGGFESPGTIETDKGSRRMEMLGNMAVPVQSEETEKIASTKKPIDRLESSKKNTEPVNYKKVEPSPAVPPPSGGASGANKTQDEAEYTDISTDSFSKDISNNTLLKNNITEKKEDHYVYYNSTFIVDSKLGKSYWVNMDQERDVIVHEMLSQSHRRAATVRLSFDFPFYGHKVRNVTVATGGFLYTGNYIHSWLAATQYIAPLMANFDTSISTESHVRYRDNGTAFTVEWGQVWLQDRRDAGSFSFQATLHSSGDIVFVYRDVPILVEHIDDQLHPVKVGLSDAYIIDRTVFFVRRKTIYEYHRVSFKREDIRNWTVIYMSALPTCLDLTTCTECLTHTTNFQCKWCSTLGRCSTGVDRETQAWTQSQCEASLVASPQECHLPPRPPSQPTLLPHVAKVTEEKREAGEAWHSGMLGAALTLSVVAALALWLFYAYRNPHTTSGQVLIKYRPSQWGLRRGEARYTAATIHM